MLGFEVAQSTVSKYMARPSKPPSQTWKTFLRNHAEAIAAIYMCVVPTLTFERLFAFLVRGARITSLLIQEAQGCFNRFKSRRLYVNPTRDLHDRTHQGINLQATAGFKILQRRGLVMPKLLGAFEATFDRQSQLDTKTFCDRLYFLHQIRRELATGRVAANIYHRGGLGLTLTFVR
jgi:hypothetical protein